MDRPNYIPRLWGLTSAPEPQSNELADPLRLPMPGGPIPIALGGRFAARPGMARKAPFGLFSSLVPPIFNGF